MKSRTFVCWFRSVVGAVVAMAAIAMPAGALPAVAATDNLIVTTTADIASPCPATTISLRCAIDSANAAPPSDTVAISFAVPTGCAASGVCTISPTTALPAVQHNNVIINGYGQSGPGNTTAHANTNPLSAGDNALIYVQLDGTNAPVGTRGLDVTGASFTVRGLSLTNWPAAGSPRTNLQGSGAVVLEASASGATLAGDFVGLAPDGSVKNNFNGFYLQGSTGATIGGTAPDAVNVVTGNEQGVVMCDSNNNVVQGNLVGTDPGGTATYLSPSHKSGTGILIEGCGGHPGSTNNLIGGTAPGAGNVISGNLTGIGFAGTYNVTPFSVPQNTRIEGNLIGTDVSGAKIPGGMGNSTGINLSGNSLTVGGTSSAARNIVSGNGTGIYVLNGTGDVIANNYIGTDISGMQSLGNGPGAVSSLSAGAGIFVGNSMNLQIGPSNIIAANGLDGVHLCQSSNLTVLSNVIGLNAGGAAAGNANAGIEISRLCDHGNTGSITIGGPSGANANVISGNLYAGVLVGTGLDSKVGAVSIQHNFVGTDATGTLARPNAGPGVAIFPEGSGTVSGVTTANNVLSGNSGDGYFVHQGSGNTMHDNMIGTDVNGTAKLANGRNGVEVEYSTGEMMSSFVSSGNANYGVLLYRSSGSTVSGACIGVDSSCNKSLPNGSNGLQVDRSSNSVVDGNVVSGNARSGLAVLSGPLNDSFGNPIAQAADGNLFTNNHVGTNKAGTAAVPNARDGFELYAYCNGSACGSANNTTIGGTLSSGGNLISGNGRLGVLVQAEPGSGVNPAVQGTKITGNTIGLDVSRSAPMGNTDDGIHILGPVAGTLIGGAATGAGNVVSANGGFGMQIDSSQTTVAGNIVGTNAGGASGLGNTKHGIWVHAGSTGTVIGGSASGAGNTIALNGSAGVAIGDNATDHSQAFISRNSIYGNGGLGIDLFPVGTVNCTGPTPGAPNDYTPCPSIDTLTSATQITGTACSGCTVEVFVASNDPDDQLHGEGKTYLGSAKVATTCGSPPCGGTDPWTLSATCSGGTCTYPSGATLSTGQFVTATATQSGAAPETSEFSQNAPVGAPTAAIVSQFTTGRHRGHIVFRWRLARPTGVVGFHVLAGRQRLNPRLIAVHSGATYRYAIRAVVQGPYQLQVLLANGRSIVYHTH